MQIFSGQAVPRHPIAQSVFTDADLRRNLSGLAFLGVSILAGEFHRFTFAELSVNSALGWAYLAPAGTVVAFGSYVWLLERISAPLVATYTFVSPIIAVLLGWMFLAEAFTALALISGALVVGSIIGLLAFDPPEDETKTAAPAFAQNRPGLFPIGALLDCLRCA